MTALVNKHSVCEKWGNVRECQTQGLAWECTPVWISNHCHHHSDSSVHPSLHDSSALPSSPTCSPRLSDGPWSYHMRVWLLTPRRPHVLSIPVHVFGTGQVSASSHLQQSLHFFLNKFLSYFRIRFHFCDYFCKLIMPFMAQMVENLPAMQENQAWSLGQEDPLEKGMATHSSILAWRIPWTEECRELQSMGSQRVGHNWATNTHLKTLAPNILCTCFFFNFEIPFRGYFYPVPPLMKKLRVREGQIHVWSCKACR